MSTLVASPPEAVDGRVLTRVVEFEMPEEGDGRTLETRIVPYNVAATVSDPPDWRPYQEMFMPGAFERQLSVPDRVKILLNFEHEQGIHGTVGRGLAFRDDPDGLYGSFALLRTSPGETALELVKAGVLTGLSLEFRTQPSWSRTVDGIRQRVKAQIDKVSLCRFPAYADAKVLAVRTEPPERQPELDPAVDELLARLDVPPVWFRAVISKPWDGSPARFSDDQYLRACLVERPGDGPAKERGSLPVLEPDGDLNTNALGAAAAALAGARGGVKNATDAQKARAARKLIDYYGRAQMEPPASLRALAGS